MADPRAAGLMDPDSSGWAEASMDPSLSKAIPVAGQRAILAAMEKQRMMQAMAAAQPQMSQAQFSGYPGTTNPAMQAARQAQLAALLRQRAMAPQGMPTAP